MALDSHIDPIEGLSFYAAGQEKSYGLSRIEGGSLSDPFYSLFREKLSQVSYNMFNHADICKSWWSNRLGFIYRC